MSTRATTTGGQLARLGFADPARAERLLQDPTLTGFADPLDDVFHDGLPDALSAAADPDQALLGLVRVLDALGEQGARDRARPASPNGRPAPDRDDERASLLVALRRPGPARQRLVAVLGGSIALVDHLVGHAGATMRADTRGTGVKDASITFAGLSVEQAQRLQVTTGSVGGQSYLYFANTGT